MPRSGPESAGESSGAGAPVPRGTPVSQYMTPDEADAHVAAVRERHAETLRPGSTAPGGWKVNAEEKVKAAERRAAFHKERWAEEQREAADPDYAESAERVLRAPARQKKHKRNPGYFGHVDMTHTLAGLLPFKTDAGRKKLRQKDTAMLREFMFAAGTNSGGMAYVMMKNLAERLGWSEREVRYSRDRLLAAGLIEVVPGRLKLNPRIKRYSVNIPALEKLIARLEARSK